MVAALQLRTNRNWAKILRINPFTRKAYDGLRFHSDEARATEIAIAAAVLNRMLDQFLDRQRHPPFVDEGRTVMPR